MFSTAFPLMERLTVVSCECYLFEGIEIVHGIGRASRVDNKKMIPP